MSGGDRLGAFREVRTVFVVRGKSVGWVNGKQSTCGSKSGAARSLRAPSRWLPTASTCRVLMAVAPGAPSSAGGQCRSEAARGQGTVPVRAVYESHCFYMTCFLLS